MTKLAASLDLVDSKRPGKERTRPFHVPPDVTIDRDGDALVVKQG